MPRKKKKQTEIVADVADVACSTKPRNATSRKPRNTQRVQKLYEGKPLLNEYQESKLFFEWALMNPILREYLIKNVNEGQRTAAQCQYLFHIGMRPGLPDYQLPISNRSWHSLWIEMKRRCEKNRAKRPEQLEWIQKLNKIKCMAVFAYGWEHAAEIVTKYLRDEI